MRVRGPQANQDATAEGGQGSQLVFLYFLFCIIENLGDLTNIPNSIFCKFSILENGCAQQGVCAHLYCMYVYVCTGVCVCVCVCVCVRARARVYAVELFSFRTPVSLTSDFPRSNQSSERVLLGFHMWEDACTRYPFSLSLSLSQTQTRHFY